MNFITFPMSATNAFPVANSTSGSQLVTEWNLRSREMVGTDPEVRYGIGPSFAHGPEDFKVDILTDGAGNLVNQYTLKISEGRAVINGHYVETLVPMTVDLVEANAKLQEQSRPPLKGKLAVGFRAFYATEETVAGSLLTENDEGMFLGIQTIVLPEEEFITPSDAPTNSSLVTADLLLATFNFVNNNITGINNNKKKVEYIDATRISDFDAAVGSQYVSKKGLNSKKLYTFAGKGTDPSTGLDTWTDSTDALMVWDNTPTRTTIKPGYNEATFVGAGESVYLVIPHKEIDGMTTSEGQDEYYEPKIITLPEADYAQNSPGIVNRSYTKQIKAISDKVEEFRTSLTGKQIYYYDTLDDKADLPPINSAWSIGDYILVGKDNTEDTANDGVRAPATMYVILPGIITAILFHSRVMNSDDIPSELTGVQLGLLEWKESSSQSEPGTTDPSTYPEFYSSDDKIRGVVGKDYFRVKYTYTDNTYANYYYTVYTTGPREWSDYIWVTGEIPLASETAIGGFLNVSDELTDYGYVYRDSAGRLRLLDYALLRSGTLAYQLAEDLTLPSGVETTEIQTYISEYVNQRVAFPNQEQLDSGSPNVINISMSLAESEEEATLNFADIDSRFNTAVCLHISGSATSTTTINIYDCQKLRIASPIEGNPIINIYRTNLYYDPDVINYVRGCERNQDSDSTFTGLQDCTFWYEQYEDDDPNLIVDHMTVSELDAPIIPNETDYWSETGTAVNDNHYLVALKSITLDGSGDIVGCGLLVANDSTDNIMQGDKIAVGEFTLPQGSGLIYPKSSLTKALKVTGTFTTAYYSTTDAVWYVTDTSFSAMTNVNDQYDQSSTAKGNIAYHSRTALITSTLTQDSIPVWEADAYHIFYGGSIG